MIEGTVNTANGEKMKIKCKGKVKGLGSVGTHSIEVSVELVVTS